MLESLARLGYASKAVVYAIVGLLAILTAVSQGGRITDTSGALRVVLSQPFGHALLIVLAVGLSGYGVWRLLDTFIDPDRNGTSPAGLIQRTGNAVRGIVYGSLGLEAFRLLRGLRGSETDPAEALSANLLDIPLGEVLVGIAGAAVTAYGVWQIIGGVRGTDDPRVNWTAMAPRVRTALRNVSRFGVIIRGGLLITLGIFLLRAAFTHNPNDAAGPRESIIVLSGVFEGRWFLALIAAGLLAYAVDQAVHAIYRRIRPVL